MTDRDDLDGVGAGFEGLRAAASSSGIFAIRSSKAALRLASISDELILIPSQSGTLAWASTTPR